MIDEEYINKIFAENFSLGELSLFLEKVISNYIPVWHPLGFITVEIFESKAHIIKLHIWPSATRNIGVNNWLIHSHNYNFFSKIIVGELCHTTYNVTLRQKTSLIIYDVINKKTGSSLKKTTTSVSSEIRTTHTYQSGDSYSFSRDMFHSIEVPKDVLTVTIFRCKKPYVSKSRVIGQSFLNYEKEHVRERVDKYLLSKLTGQILNSFTAQS